MAKKTSFETDISSEFRDVKKAIADSNAAMNERIDRLTKEINQQNRLFERELTKLNQNMEQTLKTLSQHEYRLSELEKKATVAETKTKTVGEFAKFGWFAAKFTLGVGATLGGLIGTKAVWQLVFQGT